MYLLSIVSLFILLLKIGQIQSYTCSCSCCLGSGCQVSDLRDPVDAQQCTNASCLAACKARYYQCNASPPNGQATGRCNNATTTPTTQSPSTGGPYTCECRCCNTGTYLCTPTVVGYTNAYACQVGACSIACTRQFSHVCVNNQFGQTQGTCIGTSTGSVRCGCSCYGSNGSHNYEVLTNNGCSSCYSACQTIKLQCSSYQNTNCIY